MTDDDTGTRLARIEEGVKGINARLDRMNGQVSRNTSYRIDHMKEHAVADGKAEVRAGISAKAWAAAAALLAVVQGVVAFALQVAGG